MTPRRFPAGGASVGTSATADADGTKRAAPAGPSPRRATVEATGLPPAREPGPASPVAGPGTPISSLPPILPGAAGMAVPGSGADRQRGEVAPGRGRTRTPAGASLMAHGSPPAGSRAHEAIAAAMTEDRGRDSLDAHVRRLCDDLGLLRYHTHDARRSPKGFPDLVIAGLGGVIFRELKTQRGIVKPEQQAWLNTLAAGGADAGVWRPASLLDGTIARELAALAGPRGAP